MKRRQRWVPVGVASREDHRLDAEAWVRELVKGMKADGSLPEEAALPDPTLRNVLGKWAAWKREQGGTRGDAVDSVVSAMKRYVFPHRIADVPLDRIRVPLAVDWAESLGKAKTSWQRPLAPLHRRNVVATVSTLVADIQGKGWAEIPENPFKHRHVVMTHRGAARLSGDEVIHLSAAQVNRFIGWLVEDGNRVPLPRGPRSVVALLSGLRSRELQGLAWSHIQLDAAVPYVDVRRQLEEAGSVATASFRPPKRKSFRQVPLHPVAVQALRDWRSTGWERLVCRPAGADDPVFPNASGEFVQPPTAARFRDDLAACGLPLTFDGFGPDGRPARFPFTFHATRRTFLTLLSTAGVPDSRVARLAGHGQKGVTLRSYVAHDLPELLVEVLKLPIAAAASLREPLRDGLPAGTIP